MAIRQSPSKYKPTYGILKMNRKTDRPNVLFIMSDQHRYDYLETAENAPPALNTPNLRRLAEAGISFPNCTVNAPVCAPFTHRTCFWTATLSTRSSGQREFPPCHRTDLLPTTPQSRLSRRMCRQTRSCQARRL